MASNFVNLQLQSEIQSILEDVAKAKKNENYEIHSDFKLQLGDGFVGLIFKTQMTNKDTRQVTELIIKKSGYRPLNYHEIFGNEILFYTKYLPVLDDLQKHLPVAEQFNNIPKYYASSLTPQMKYIALQNLSTQGYVLYDKSKFWDQKHFEKIFMVYGKFHAMSFVLRKNNPELYKYISDSCVDTCVQFVQEASEIMEAAVAEIVDGFDENAAAYQVSKKLVGNVKNTLLNALKYNGDFRCITHGDCWSNNMLFKYGNNGEIIDLKLVDFQLITDRTPIHDLSYFFYSGAAKEDMDKIEYYLQIYYDSFIKHATGLHEDPQKLLPFTTLINEWKKCGIIGVLLSIHLWQLKLLPKENFVNKLRERNVEKKASDDETRNHFLKLMKEIRKGESYRKKTLDILIHAFNYGVLTEENIVKRK